MNDLDMERVFSDPSLRYMMENFLTYSRHIVSEKAIPSIVDGLLPTQRRYILAMAMLGCGSDSKPMKSTTVGAYVTGNLSPQGNPYSVLVGQSQYYRVPQMLVKPSGNFGEPEANAASADRYTETQLSEYSEEVLLKDLPSKPVLPVDKRVDDRVPYKTTYTRVLKEPETLPARIPSLLINGNNGIGVSISQTWPMLTFEFLLKEYLNWLEGRPIEYSNLTMGHPSMVNVISSQEDFIKALKSGHGSVRMAPRFGYVRLNNNPRGRVVAVDVLACPPYVSINNIGDSFNQWRNRDSECVWESFRNNSSLTEDSVLKSSVTLVRMTFYLKSKYQTMDTDLVDKYVSILYSKTGLVQNYTINMTALGVDGFPREYTLESFFEAWTEQRLETIRRIALAEKSSLESELHRTKVLRFGRINSSRIKEAIQFVEKDDSVVNAVIRVMKELTPSLEVSVDDARAILNIPLSASTASSIENVERKLEILKRDIERFHNLSQSLTLRKTYIYDEVEWFITHRESIGCREIVNPFDENLGRILHLKDEVKKVTVSEIFTFDCDDKCSDIIAGTKKGYYARISTRAVNSVLPYEPDIPYGDSLVMGGYIHSSYIFFVTDRGRLLQVPVGRIPYGIPQTPEMLRRYSVINSGVPLESVTYMETFSRNPKYIYLSDGVFFKLVDIKDISTRAVLKMPSAIKRVCLLSGMEDLYGTSIDVSGYIGRASRVGRLPKLIGNSYIFCKYPTDRNDIEIVNGSGIIKRLREKNNVAEQQ